MSEPSPVQPATLRPGDVVALVAPSGAVRPHQAATTRQVLTDWGLQVRMGRPAQGRHTYLSGTDHERLTDFNDALRDDEVRGVVCLRGGYGAQRIVDEVDFAAVRADPNLMMGFSDITALHVALWCETRLATVHGPTGAKLDKEADSPTTRAAYHALMTRDAVTVAADQTESTFDVRVAGQAKQRWVSG